MDSLLDELKALVTRATSAAAPTPTPPPTLSDADVDRIAARVAEMLPKPEPASVTDVGEPELEEGVAKRNPAAPAPPPTPKATPPASSTEPPVRLDADAVSKMSAAEINEQWPAISAALERGE